MLWIALAFAAYSLLATGLYFRECDRHDEVRSQLDDTQDLRAANAALRGMIGNADRDLYAAWRDACRERDAAIEHAQQVVIELQELRRRFGRAVGHPSADGDPTPPHGIERPALKIVEGL